VTPKLTIADAASALDQAGLISRAGLAQPQQVKDATGPWSVTLTTAPAASANIVALGDSDTIGCVIVNGEVKVEKTFDRVNARTFCSVKSA